MTRRVRLCIAAMLSVAAMGLMIGLTVAAHAGVGQAHNAALTPTAVEYAVMLAL